MFLQKQVKREIKIIMTMTNATGFHTLKDYIGDYQQKGNESMALNHLIIISSNEDSHTKISFRDKSIDFIYNNLMKKYESIAGHDNIQNWFINGLYERVFANADLDYDSAQIVKWASIELDGYIKRKINTELENVDQVISESYVSADGMEQTHYDDSAYDEYFNILNEDNQFERYIDSLGGLGNLLTARQHEIYDLSNIEGATHQSIADSLTITQQAVTKAISTAKNKIRKEYLNFKLFMQLKEDTTVHEKINQYLENYANIMTFDIDDSFDYFSYTINFLKDNASQTDKDDVIDVLMENVHSASRKLFTDVLSHKVYSDDSKVIFTKRQQDQFVMGVTREFNKYIKSVNESIKVFSDNVVSFADSDNGYEKVAKIFA